MRLLHMKSFRSIAIAVFGTCVILSTMINCYDDTQYFRIKNDYSVSLDVDIRDRAGNIFHFHEIKPNKASEYKPLYNGSWEYWIKGSYANKDVYGDVSLFFQKQFTLKETTKHFWALHFYPNGHYQLEKEK